jgi:hypothetical protein
MERLESWASPRASLPLTQAGRAAAGAHDHRRQGTRLRRGRGAQLPTQIQSRPRGAGAEAGHGRRRAAWVHAGAREDEMVPAAAAAGVREAAEDLAAAGERAGDTVA